jgi:hypothetical protein
MLFIEIVVGGALLFVAGYIAWIVIAVGPGSPNIRVISRPVLSFAAVGMRNRTHRFCRFWRPNRLISQAR